MYDTRFKGSFKAVPIYVYKPRSIRKRTLGSISCNTTTSRSLRLIPSQLSTFGVTPGLRLIIQLQLPTGVCLIPNTCLLTKTRENNKEQSGRDYTITEPTWLIDSQLRENDILLHAEHSILGRLKSSQATIRCIVTLNRTSRRRQKQKVSSKRESCSIKEGNRGTQRPQEISQSGRIYT